VTGAERTLPELIEAIDGLLLPGGGDLPPRLWGEETQVAGELIADERAEQLLALTRAGFEAGIPTLGICLGCQVMNVALGGSVVQDLAERAGAVEHRARGDNPSPHPVAIQPRTRLGAALGVSRFTVASDHHQAIGIPGADLKVTAMAPDNVIEGIEHVQAPFFVGVQWHPELGLNEAPNRRLFEALVRHSGASPPDS